MTATINTTKESAAKQDCQTHDTAQNERLNMHHLLRLLMLSSTALPVGSYCYSQGVETAIENQLINNEESAQTYFDDILELVLIRYELPNLVQMMQAKTSEQFLQRANRYRASRESRELLAETQQMGFSLNAWIKDVLKQPIEVDSSYGFLPIYAQLASRLGLPISHCMAAYAFAMLENQVLATVKTLPLGQMAGQRILWHLHMRLVDGIKRALEMATQTHFIPSNNLPAFAAMSIQHEEQYSRLFRS